MTGRLAFDSLVPVLYQLALEVEPRQSDGHRYSRDYSYPKTG